MAIESGSLLLDHAVNWPDTSAKRQPIDRAINRGPINTSVQAFVASNTIAVARGLRKVPMRALRR